MSFPIADLLASFLSSTALASCPPDIHVMRHVDGTFSFADRQTKNAEYFTYAVAEFCDYGAELAHCVGTRSAHITAQFLRGEASRLLAHSAIEMADQFGLSYLQAMIVYFVGLAAVDERLSALALHGMAAPCRAQ